MEVRVGNRDIVEGFVNDERSEESRNKYGSLHSMRRSWHRRVGRSRRVGSIPNIVRICCCEQSLRSRGKYYSIRRRRVLRYNNAILPAAMRIILTTLLLLVQIHNGATLLRTAHMSIGAAQTTPMSTRLHTSKDSLKPLNKDCLNLSNTYVLLRHGQSTSNVEGIISSCPSLSSSNRHPLTEQGVEQSFQAGKDLYNLLMSGSSLLPRERSRNLQFVSSPFARTRQTTFNCVAGFLSCVEEVSYAELTVMAEMRTSHSTHIQLSSLVVAGRGIYGERPRGEVRRV